MRVDSGLWRAVAGFRIAAWAYAVLLFAQVQDEYVHPSGGWAVLAMLGVWSLAAPPMYASLRTRAAALGIDLGVAAGAIGATAAFDSAERIQEGAQTLPVIWPGAVVICWGLCLGWAGGLFSALAILAVGIAERGQYLPPAASTLHNGVLLILLGTIIGYGAGLVRRAHRELEAVRAAEAALQERERLGRVVHDGVLQVLALTARRAAGSPDPDLAALAVEADLQEQALRSLVSRQAAHTPQGERDLAERLRALEAPRVSVAVPAEPVELPTHAADEVEAAVRAALDNVDRHAGQGAKVWVLLEDLGHEILVSVRDDGPGFASGRLEQAQEAGRMGVRSSIIGRIEDLGGRATVESWPGGGTEVEMAVPKAPRSAA